MKFFKSVFNSIFSMKRYMSSVRVLYDPYLKDAKEKTHLETLKTPTRTEIINFLLSNRKGETRYLEIGVRDPNGNYNHIIADEKYGVDPGIAYEKNPVDFKMTSDDFYKSLLNNKILYSDIRFDVIFIDGLHLAEQVDRDIMNSMKFIRDDGFIVLHDCNPPTEWHARERGDYINTPAECYWNGTTWKAFLKWRSNPAVNSCCIDSDWGVGILSKQHQIGSCIEQVNQFFEFASLIEHKNNHLNLISFDDFKIMYTNLRI